MGNIMSSSSRRGTRIKINPRRRYDLSHLTTDEASKTLKHILDDLCFWGKLLPQNRNQTPHYNYHFSNNHHHNNPYAAQDLIRHTSSGSERSQRSKNQSNYSSSRSAQGRDSLPPRAQQGKVWKTAVDPATGQTYYYDPVTRQTQWEKPDEIRAMEKQQRKERRQRDKAFFEEMEKNMRGHFADGKLTKDYSARDLSNCVGGPPKEPLGLQVPTKQQRIRTISAMDERMLAQVDVEAHSSHETWDESLDRKPPRTTTTATTATNIRPTPSPPASSTAPGRPPLPRASSAQPNTTSKNGESSPEESHTSRVEFDRWDSLELSPDNTSSHGPMGSPELQGMHLLDENPIYHSTGYDYPSQNQTVAVEEEKQPVGHIRRNTGNTMFVNTTMTSPDIRGTVKCVCGVYRTHILQSVESPSHSPGSVVPVGSTVINPDVFRDDWRDGTHNGKGWNKSPDRKSSSVPSVPTMEEVEMFYNEFFRRSQMEHDTIIMSLIYIERLIKRTEGSIRPTPENWRSMLFSCMILASKVWDDLSMWNIDFSNVSVATGLSSFTIQRVNQLEVAVLSILRFDVRVPASEYAKYYFLIRTMLFRSGQISAEASQNVPPSMAIDQSRRAKSVDWGAEPLLMGVGLGMGGGVEQLLSK